MKLPRAVARRRNLRQSTDRESLFCTGVSGSLRGWRGCTASGARTRWASAPGGPREGCAVCAARDEHGRLSLPRWPGLIVFADRRTLEAARAGQTGRPAGEEARRLAGVRPQRRRTCLGSGWRAHASTARQTHSSTRTTDDGRGAQNRSSSLLRRFSHSPGACPVPASSCHIWFLTCAT